MTKKPAAWVYQVKMPDGTYEYIVQYAARDARKILKGDERLDDKIGAAIARLKAKEHGD